MKHGILFSDKTVKWPSFNFTSICYKCIKITLHTEICERSISFVLPVEKITSGTIQHTHIGALVHGDECVT